MSNFSQVSSEFGRRLTEALAEYHMVGIFEIALSQETISISTVLFTIQEHDQFLPDISILLYPRSKSKSYNSNWFITLDA